MNVSDWLSICDIGGLGETAITATRFYMYSLEVNKGFSPLLIPECEIDEPPTTVKKYYLTGQQILVSLYNLFEEIRPIEDELLLMSRKVMGWCTYHAHPYDIVTINAMIPDVKDYNEPTGSLVSHRTWYEQKSKEILEVAQINLMDFMNDLRDLYERTKTYYAIIEAQQGDFRQIEEISKTVLNFESEWNRIAKRIAKNKAVTAEVLESYAKTITEMKITLRFDSKKSTYYLAPELNSVFDIANYALVRLIATNAPNLEDGDSKVAIAFCSGCGKMFVKTGNRQKFCEDETCQAIRNARKAAAYRERKKRNVNDR